MGWPSDHYTQLVDQDVPSVLVWAISFAMVGMVVALLAMVVASLWEQFSQ